MIMSEKHAPTAVILRAIKFAADKHRNQRRKDAEQTPYINHPIAVAETLASIGGVNDVDLLLAAILHDTVEDTDTTPEELEEQFGSAVRTLVAEVTDDKSLPKAERKRLQIENTPHKSDNAKQLKLADKLCNISDITFHSPSAWPLDRKLDYITWAEQVVAGCRGVNAKLERHFEKVLEGKRRNLGG